MGRKLFYIILLSCCMFGLTGCGKSEVEHYEIEIDVKENEAKENTDASSSDSTNTNTSSIIEEVKEIVATEEILTANRYSNKVQIGSTVYEFPLTVSKLLENGELKLVPAEDENTHEGTLVAPEKTQSFGLTGLGVDIVLYGKNNTDAIIELKDCLVEASVIKADSNNNTNIIFNEGLRAGITLNELTELFGEPDYFDTDNNIYWYIEDMFEYESDGVWKRYSVTDYKYAASIDMNTGCITSIEYYIGDEQKKNREYIELDILCDEGFTAHCYVPKDISYYDFFDIQQSGKRLIEADGKKYVLSMATDTGTYPLTNITVDTLNKIYGNKIVHHTINTDGTAYVITSVDKENNYYCTGDYFVNNKLVQFMMDVAKTSQNDKEPISETAKQEARDILKEILEQGATIHEQDK